jgi:predicted lipoprotein
MAPLVVAGATALVAGCERIGFYSTGRATPETTSASTTTSTSAATTGGTSTTTTRAALLGAIATCSLDLFTSFRAAAEELDAAAKEAQSDPAAQEKARAAWINAIDLWQRAELFQFGPAGPASTPGGEALRDHIYSWPLVSRCLIEQTIVSKAYEAQNFGATSLVNTRGLAAAEYLLFYTGTDNACSPATAINASGQWAALAPAELAARKASYASAAAADVAERSRALASAWSADGGNFVAHVANAGAGSSVYANEQAALNAISDAMFYIEIAVKDLKLARPLGIMDCEDATCPQALESRYAGRSKQHIRNNLLGFRMLIAGCDDGEGTGFDDLLASIGAGALGESMRADTFAAIDAVDAIPGDDLGAALEGDIASVQKAHAAVKKITDALKTNFVSVLDLELPKTVEGDND